MEVTGLALIRLVIAFTAMMDIQHILSGTVLMATMATAPIHLGIVLMEMMATAPTHLETQLTVAMVATDQHAHITVI